MKRWQKNTLKIAFTLILLTLLYRKVDGKDFLQTLQGVRFEPLIGFFVLCVVNMWLSSTRWGLLLHADGLPIPISKLFVSHWIASFFNFFMPSNIGGDVYRIADIAQKSGKTVNSVASVFVDRLTGFLAMSALGFIFPLMGLRQVPLEHRWKLAIPLCVFMGFLVVAALVWQQRFLRACTHLFPSRLRTRIESLLVRFLESIQQYSKTPQVLLRCLLLSLLFQFLVIVAVYCVGCALRLPIPFFSYCIFVPLVCLLESVPSTINGMGFRDAGYIMFFTAVGLTHATEAAPAMSLLYMALTLLYASCGGLLFFRRLHRPVSESSHHA